MEIEGYWLKTSYMLGIIKIKWVFNEYYSYKMNAVFTTIVK